MSSKFSGNEPSIIYISFQKGWFRKGEWRLDGYSLADIFAEIKLFLRLVEKAVAPATTTKHANCVGVSSQQQQLAAIVAVAAANINIAVVVTSNVISCG
jgi:hypothetical protein